MAQFAITSDLANKKQLMSFEDGKLTLHLSQPVLQNHLPAAGDGTVKPFPLATVSVVDENGKLLSGEPNFVITSPEGSNIYEYVRIDASSGKVTLKKLPPEGTTELQFHIDANFVQEGQSEEEGELISSEAIIDIDLPPTVTPSEGKKVIEEHPEEEVEVGSFTRADGNGDRVVVFVESRYKDIFGILGHKVVVLNKEEFDFEKFKAMEMRKGISVSKDGTEVTLKLKLLAKSKHSDKLKALSGDGFVTITITDDKKKEIDVDYENDLFVNGKVVLQKHDAAGNDTPAGTKIAKVKMKNLKEGQEKVEWTVFDSSKYEATEFFEIKDGYLVVANGADWKDIFKTQNLQIRAFGMDSGELLDSFNVAFDVNELVIDEADLDDNILPTEKEIELKLSLGTDTDGDPLTLRSTDKTATDGGGEFRIAGGKVFYTPPEGDGDGLFLGEDSFKIRLHDGKKGTRDATVTVTVSPAIDVGEKVHAREDSMRLFGSKVTLHEKLADKQFDLAVLDKMNTKVKIDSDGKTIEGKFGNLIINKDGSWQFLVDNSPDNKAIEDLNGKKDAEGNALSFETQKFTLYFTNTQDKKEVHEVTLKIQIDGSTDYYASNPDHENYRFGLHYRDSDEDLTLHSDPTKSVTRLVGGNGNDVLKGSDGQDYLEGRAGNDELYGGAGYDYLVGGTGNDILYGGAGDDDLFGGGGDDRFYGGPGDDWLGGWEGNDDFVLDISGSGRDRVGGFTFGGKTGSTWRTNIDGEQDQIAIRFSAADIKAIENAANPLDMLKEKAGIEFKKVKDSDIHGDHEDTIIYKTADNVELMELNRFTTPLTFEMFALLPLEPEVA